jgi:hypothetical protein
MPVADWTETHHRYAHHALRPPFPAPPLPNPTPAGLRVYLTGPAAARESRPQNESSTCQMNV